MNKRNIIIAISAVAVASVLLSVVSITGASSQPYKFIKITDQNTPKKPDVTLSPFQLVNGKEIPIVSGTKIPIVAGNNSTTIRLHLVSFDDRDLSYKFKLYNADDKKAAGLALSRLTLNNESNGLPKGLNAVLDTSATVLKAHGSLIVTLAISATPSLPHGTYDVDVLAVTNSGTAGGVGGLEVDDGKIQTFHISVS